MKLFEKQLPALAREIVEALVQAKDIELEPGAHQETILDIQAILAEYARSEREVCQTAKDLLAARDWPSDRFGEARRMAASMRRVPLDDEAIEYVFGQIVEFLMHSSRVAEVFAADNVMRKRISDILRRHIGLHKELDAEVRRRIKHLQEGTRDWEIAYQKNMEQVRRAKGLD